MVTLLFKIPTNYNNWIFIKYILIFNWKNFSENLRRVGNFSLENSFLSIFLKFGL